MIESDFSRIVLTREDMKDCSRLQKIICVRLHPSPCLSLSPCFWFLLGAVRQTEVSLQL